MIDMKYYIPYRINQEMINAYLDTIQIDEIFKKHAVLDSNDLSDNKYYLEF